MFPKLLLSLAHLTLRTLRSPEKQITVELPCALHTENEMIPHSPQFDFALELLMSQTLG
jgi:hypothetical protein